MVKVGDRVRLYDGHEATILAMKDVTNGPDRDWWLRIKDQHRPSRWVIAHSVEVLS